MAEAETPEERRRRLRGNIVDDETTREDDLAPAYFFSQDGDLLNDIKKDPDLKPIAPLFSPLNRLTKLTTKERDKWNTQIDLIFAMLIAGTDRRDFNATKWAKLRAARLFLKTTINDAHKGFKMTLMSRVRKEVVVSGEERKGFFEKLRKG